MKRLIYSAALALVLFLLLGIGLAFSETIFKIPFKFEADGKKYPPGEYRVAQKEEGKITLRRESTGEEVSVANIEELPRPEPQVETPQLIFDMVANFEPSYTEYVTDYLLAEVWMTEKEGFLVLGTERSEYRKSVKGVGAIK